MQLLTEPFFPLVNGWLHDLATATTVGGINKWLVGVGEFITDLLLVSAFGNYTLLELICGAGIWLIVAYTIAKWIADIIF